MKGSAEVFDTSHMQSQANVGSKIVWSHYKFKKDEYRHYNLESKDEYSQMRELLTKRAESFDKLLLSPGL
jgi:excinuclease ABC subunit C